MRSGQSILEVVIAVGLFLIGVVAAGSLLLTQFTSFERHRDTLNSLLQAELGLEATRAVRNRDWFSLRPGNYIPELRADGTITLNPAPEPLPATGHTITIAATDDTTREVTSTVRWESAPGFIRDITLRTRFTDWWFVGRGSAPTGDWSRPTLSDPPPSPITEGGGTGVAVRSRTAYLSVASAEGEPDFYIIDAADPATLRVLGSLEIPTNTHGTDDVAIHGDYAYLASRDDDFVLHIVDIRDPRAPLLVSTLSLPDFEEAAKTVAIRYPHVFLGTYEEDDDDPGEQEFWVIDVSDPRSPRAIASLEYDGDIQDIVIAGDRAFVASEQGEYHEFTVVDISTPTVPRVIEDFDLRGSGSGHGISPLLEHNLVAGVRFEGNPEFVMLDATDPLNLSELGTARAPEHFHKVLGARPLVFTAGTHNARELVIYDITDPGSPRQLSTVDLTASGEGMAFERNYLYVATRRDDRPLAIITAP